MRLDPFSTARRIIGGAPKAAGPARRRRRGRPDAPRTIVPELEPAGEPAESEPLSLERLDAARARLRAAIPPRADDE